jgi:hypothetical protein
MTALDLERPQTQASMTAPQHEQRETVKRV